MMLPARKTDLGMHCFGYAWLLSSEFYGDKPLDRLGLAGSERPSDALAEIRSELDADWAAVQKDQAGRVTLEAFKVYFMNKYQSKLPQDGQAPFEAFLEQNFKSSTAMMLPETKTTLGGHCFRYSAIM